MKVVYVAGKFTGATDWDRAQNVRAAEAAGLEVARAGAMPLIPQANTSLFFGQLDEQFWYDGTMELLKRCDAIYVFDQKHIETSKGTRAEVNYAIANKIPVVYTIDRLKQWLAGAVKLPWRINDVVFSKALGVYATVRAVHSTYLGLLGQVHETLGLVRLSQHPDGEIVEVDAADVSRPNPIVGCDEIRQNGLFKCVLPAKHGGGCAPSNWDDV